MRQVELGARARLIVLSGRAGRDLSSSSREFPTVREAVRHVMEIMPADQRQNAVIEAQARLLFFPEIEAVFETRLPLGEQDRSRAQPFPILDPA